MSCSYAAPGSRKKHSTTSSSSGGPDDMQNRIDRLEGLVLSLMTNGSQSTGPAAAQRALSLQSSSGSMDYPQDVEIDGVEENAAPRGEESDTEQVAQSLGVMRVDNNKSMYYGDAHWAAILSDVRTTSFSTLEEELTYLRFLKSRITFQSTRSSMKPRWRKFSKPKRSTTLLPKGQLSFLVVQGLHPMRSFLPSCQSALFATGWCLDISIPTIRQSTFYTRLRGTDSTRSTG